MSVQANAGLIPKLGGQVVYDDDRDITWLSDANLAASNTFGVPGINTFTAGWMTWSTANAFINAMNAANYLGFNDWRLPTIVDPDFSCTSILGDPVAGPEGYNCSGSDMGHLYFDEFHAVISANVLISGNQAELAKFKNIETNNYWSVDSIYSASAWSFNFYYGRQGTAYKTFEFFVWPVRDGDVDTSQPPPSLPKPMSWLPLLLEDNN